jgi:Zn-dependent protease/CBS domain-containing protein
MNPHGVRLGRVAGIDVVADRSWALIFLLVTWNLTEVFLRSHASWGFGASSGLAVVAALLFFGSILVHELAHALVARRLGIPVRSITLFLFGGVSNIEREPPSPAAEFWMAIVGPVTSFALGGIFLSAWVLIARPAAGWGVGIGLAGLGPLSTLLLWLGPVNVTIGVFNLVPGFPLDGGRVLRAALWGITHDLRRATRWASAVGQVIGWSFVLAGVTALFGVPVRFIGQGPIAGLWAAFIGWFLASAAARTYQGLLVHDALEGVPVWRLMRTAVPSASPDANVGDVIRDAFIGSDERALAVMDPAGRLVGVLAITDLRRAPRERWDSVPVRDLMTPVDHLVVTTPDEDVAAALRRLEERGVHQLPVVDKGRLAGMLRAGDVLRWVELSVHPPIEGRRAANH